MVKMVCELIMIMTMDVKAAVGDCNDCNERDSISSRTATVND